MSKKKKAPKVKELLEGYEPGAEKDDLMKDRSWLIDQLSKVLGGKEPQAATKHEEEPAWVVESQEDPEGNAERPPKRRLRRKK